MKTKFIKCDNGALLVNFQNGEKIPGYLSSNVKVATCKLV